MTDLMTRADYMAHACTLDEFFGQFVQEGTIGFARDFFGAEYLLRTTDPHLNDHGRKPQLDAVTGWTGKLWGHQHFSMDNVQVPFNKLLLVEANGGGISNSDVVCVLKTAARIWIERQKEVG